ncbi:MAG: ATP-binding cassette domain-containing protein, partial [Deltaproteobacteria bacterium]|nr:ATP-binding cassette domain-containing protein [Deltaproteobacteria bacterium]
PQEDSKSPEDDFIKEDSLGDEKWCEREEQKKTEDHREEKRTAEDNIAIPLQIKGISRSVKSAKIKDITHKLKISQILKQQVRSLSGGEQQLIAIARAAVHSPTLILADEPTANLDPRMATRIFDMLTLLNEEGMTVVVATHDINLLKAHKKRILLLKQSALIEVH